MSVKFWQRKAKLEKERRVEDDKMWSDEVMRQEKQIQRLMRHVMSHERQEMMIQECEHEPRFEYKSKLSHGIWYKVTSAI